MSGFKMSFADGLAHEIKVDGQQIPNVTCIQISPILPGKPANVTLSVLCSDMELEMNPADVKMDIQQTQSMSIRYSVETIVNYSCGSCSKWFSISGGPTTGALTCPHCDVMARIDEIPL